MIGDDDEDVYDSDDEDDSDDDDDDDDDWSGRFARSSSKSELMAKRAEQNKYLSKLRASLRRCVYGSSAGKTQIVKTKESTSIGKGELCSPAHTLKFVTFKRQHCPFVFPISSNRNRAVLDPIIADSKITTIKFDRKVCFLFAKRLAFVSMVVSTSRMTLVCTLPMFLTNDFNFNLPASSQKDCFYYQRRMSTRRGSKVTCNADGTFAPKQCRGTRYVR